LPFHGNRWNEGPIGFRIAVKGPPKGRFMRKKSQLHHNLEAGRTEAIMKIVIVGMGMSNRQRIITQLQKKYMKKLRKMLEITQCKGRNPRQHWQK